MSSRFARSFRIVLLPALIVITAFTAAGSSAADSSCSSDADFCNVLQGYTGNMIEAGAIGATISGGGVSGSPNRVSGDFGTVGGGKGNLAGEGSTVSGGYGNTAMYFHATVGGGTNNSAVAQEATVAGGLMNTASERFTTVSGGTANTASEIHATVGGGSVNAATGRFSTVAGGTENIAGSISVVVAGGTHNLAKGPFDSILGGLNNTANGYASSLGGGAGNEASGDYSVIPGGFANSAAGDFSFAAGRNAQVSANHTGSFLFADSNRFAFPSLAADEFAIRATGGIRFTTGIDESGSPLAGVRLSPGSGSWETLSDVNAKAGFAPVDGRQILEQLMNVPISSWYYRSQDPSIRHIGPTAQDFYSAFAVGQDGRYISIVDQEGVALAAIQELYRIVQKSQVQCRASQPADQALENKIASLENRLTSSNLLAAVTVATSILSLWRRKRETLQ